MTTTQALLDLMEKANGSHYAFEVESQLTGATVIWNIPAASLDLFLRLLNERVTLLNIEALRIFNAGKIDVDRQIYTLTQSTATNERLCNLRVQLNYEGPKLDSPLPGILIEKVDIRTWMMKNLHEVIDRIRLVIRQQERGTKKIPVDVSYQSAVCKIVGRYLEDGVEMMFEVTPVKKTYAPLIVAHMPDKVNGIVIRPCRQRDGRMVYSVAAVGKPYLERIGKMLDNVVRPLIASPPIRRVSR